MCHRDVDWSGLLSSAGFVSACQEHLRWEQMINREMLVARVRSVSYIAATSPDAQAATAQRVAGLVDGLEEPFPLPYISHIFWARSPL